MTPKARRLVVTKDGSPTFYNERYGEHYHGTAGAAKESMVKFAEPCLKGLLDRDEIAILDICFGLGYNTAAAIDLIRLRNPACKITIIGLENDEQVLEELQDIEPGFENYAIIKEAAIAKRYDRHGISIELLMGDARETIKTIEREFDAVFLQPFSPKSCPELWTREFFLDIKRLMKPGAIMATFSCATEVRQNMRECGFIVKNGVIFGRKAPSTLAVMP